jgi:hypothetical protein
MSRETQLRIFEPFFTTKFSGRGLGLASALGIVQGHRGVIRIESRLGEGTRFLVLLPCSSAQSAAALEVKDLPASGSGEGVVLVVDDDEPMLRLTTLFLEDAGFDVRTALGGRAALLSSSISPCPTWRDSKCSPRFGRAVPTFPSCS